MKKHLKNEQTNNHFLKLQQSIRWNLFFILGSIMLICQVVTVLWLWHESKEQIDVLVDLTLSKNHVDQVIKQEEFEAILALFSSAFIMMSVTLLLSYKAIKWIIKPLENLETELNQRTAENLTAIATESNMREIKSITFVLNSLFLRLHDTLNQERMFTADVAHELRTPLAGIRLHLELLEKDKKIDCQELIARIDRLVRTVEQLLMLARASQKFTIGKYQEINFHDDIKVPLFDELFELTLQKNQHLKWDIVNKDLRFNGDETLIKLLVRNLVENAYRYSPNGSHMTVIFKQEHDNIVIAVQDEGIGIDETKSKELTQAFFRMDRKHKGVGLGLSIVSRIAKLHQAEFLIKNREDNCSGTIAKIVLSTP